MAKRARQKRLLKPWQIRMAKAPTPRQAARLAGKAVELAIYAKYSVSQMKPSKERKIGSLTAGQISWNKSNFQGHVNAIQELLDSPITLKNVESRAKEIRARVSAIEYRIQVLGIKKPN